MTASTNDRLYRLLPAVHRLRDGEQGEPLRALLAVMEGQVDTLRADLAGLYDNWFIETCDEWVVPYIGDLLGVRGQYTFDNASMTMRPFVANTLRYRRSKGTASMLEGLATDVTGWRTRAVEFFQLLGTTEYLNHNRSADLRTPDLRDTNALELLGGPWERAMHYADVRRISTRHGKYNIGNVGLFLWRLEAPVLDRMPAVAASGIGPGRYWFDQLGRDLPLFNPRHAETSDRARESDMPGPLRSRALFEELRGARSSLAAGETPTFEYWNRPDGMSAFEIYADYQRIPPEQIQICDLSNWSVMPTAETVQVPDPADPSHQITLSALVSVDPVLGRLVYLGSALPKAVHVSYQLGFSADIGGGGYARASARQPISDYEIDVDVLDGTQAFDAAFVQALAAWDPVKHASVTFVFRGPPGFADHLGAGRFSVADFAIPAGCSVTLRAADDSRPVLMAKGPWQVSLDTDAKLVLDGLWVSGGPLTLETRLPPGSPKPEQSVAHTVTIADCTLVPGTGSSLVTSAASRGDLELVIVRSVTGAIDVTAGDIGANPNVSITDSIIDGGITTHEALGLTHVTVLGTTSAKTLDADQVIFDSTVNVMRTQTGCVRYSYVPPGSVTPRTYRCQPQLALDADSDPSAQQHILDRLRPSYTSRHYGDSGYAQLAGDCPVEIAAGAEKGAEMGAFQMLLQPQRLANLAISLDEYLRFGLEAGVFLVT